MIHDGCFEYTIIRTWFCSLILLLLFILAGLILIFRNRRKSRPAQVSGPIGPWKLLVSFLKLLGFGLAALVLVRRHLDVL